MLSINKIIQKSIICALMVTTGLSTVQGQTNPGTAKAKSTQPSWWFGVSGAANFNFFSGTTQRLNNSLIVPAAFHKGNGVRPYGSVFMEFRPASALLGAMLNVGYDGRGGKFDGVIAPCDCPATLQTNLSYVTVEPSLRLALPASNFYFFAGPRFAFNLKKGFEYTQLNQPNTDGDLSAVRKNVISGQVGMGYEFPISKAGSATQVNLSPFVSYHPYFGQDPRDIESLSISTLRTGIALKFGKASKAAVVETPLAEVPLREVTFAVRGPLSGPVTRLVSETLPLRNSVFFDEGSSDVPNRYVLLTQDQATTFNEASLQQEPAESKNVRSSRQMNVYHNILNILGDRMRSNPTATISLSGASAKGPVEGKAFAESIKQYLVNAFSINSTRIATAGRTKPLIPSEKPGATKELTLLRAGDRRVDIQSNSPELLMEVGGGMMKPVQIVSTVSPLDSQVVFNVDGANDLLKSYTLEITDENGTVQKCGPFTRDQESLTVSSILGNREEGEFKVTMLGINKNGTTVTKEGNVHLKRQPETLGTALRYSILFDFDKSKSIASYNKFLTDVVSPMIVDGSTVVIQGHTDVIGQDGYNQKLSDSRARETQKVIQSALSKAGKNNVKFETAGFGEDLNRAPFENNLPEERFYNRTVIIDIIPVK
jgi:outer membrane protein OmpA-like peptidoglycan-associated protein